MYHSIECRWVIPFDRSSRLASTSQFSVSAAKIEDGSTVLSISKDHTNEPAFWSNTSTVFDPPSALRRTARSGLWYLNRAPLSPKNLAGEAPRSVGRVPLWRKNIQNSISSVNRPFTWSQNLFHKITDYHLDHVELVSPYVLYSIRLEELMNPIKSIASVRQMRVTGKSE